MKYFGYIMITVGFLVGSLAAVMEKGQEQELVIWMELKAVNWNYYLPALLLGGLGVLTVRLADKAEKGAGGILAANIGELEKSLAGIVANINRFTADKDRIAMSKLPGEIERLFGDDLAVFVENRKSIIYRHGVGVYAEVMSSFAAADRYLNRVWSAATDGYGVEAFDYLDRAQEQFTAAWECLRGLEVKPEPVRESW